VAPARCPDPAVVDEQAPGDHALGLLHSLRVQDGEVHVHGFVSPRRNLPDVIHRGF
jgi:hypothetical protein